MNFTSEIFLFYFLPITFALYFALKRYSVTWSLAWLSFASLLFYAWEVPYYVFIILFSVLVDWVVSNVMVKTESRTKRLALLIASLCSNLGLLAFFKYSSFFADNLGILSGFLGVDLISADSKSFFNSIVLPVGISFYTFQTLSYTIDIYDGKIHKARSFIEFLAYVSSFPQLVAGPIVRYSEVSGQLKNPKVNRTDVQEGVSLFILGLSKKVLIADTLAPVADVIFDQAGITNGLLNLIGVIAYGLQIYFDFSGYSEMAVGLGRLLGFKFPQNFNSPYKSKNMRDFWRRWHMSLSYWFRDYVYIKMGGSRCSPLKQKWNLIAAMSLCGFWHGAGWNFMFWGFGHGVALVIDKYFSNIESRVMNIIRRFWCLLAVFFLWIPFRANETEDTYRIINNISTNILKLQGIGPQLKGLPHDVLLGLLVVGPAAVLSLYGRNVYELKKELVPLNSIVLTILFTVCVYVLLSREYIPFLYFQF